MAKNSLLHQMAAVTVFVTEERNEPFSVEQEWMVCFGCYHQGYLEKRTTACLSKLCKITCTGSTYLIPIRSEKQNLAAQNACAYVRAGRVCSHRAHAKSMCTGLAPQFVQH